MQKSTRGIWRHWRPAIALSLILASSGPLIAKGPKLSGYYQQTSPASAAKSDEHCKETAQLLTRALLELEHCRNEGKISKDEVAALKSTEAALNAALETDKKQLADLKAANAARSNADALATEEITLYEKRINLYKSSIADYETEVTRLRKERDRARGLLKFVAGAGFLLGLAVAYTITKR